jgi:outer membrane lipopolysaccharide assembly protein LptE/RlpB
MQIKKTGPVRNIVLIIVLVLLLFSCGYQLVREKGIYGGDISSVYISVFKNMTYEPHISQYVTDAFSKELVSTGLFTVNKESSDGYLQSAITKITTQPYSMSAAGITIEKMVTLDVDIALYKKNGSFVKRWPLSDSETYRVDNTNYEDYNKTEAIKRLSARMARRFSAVLFVDY